MPELDPNECAFCEEDPQPVVGRMLVVVAETLEELIPYEESQFGACRPHSFEYGGSHVGTHKETGQEAVLQFQHKDFKDDPDEIAALGAKLAALTCGMCDQPIYEPDQPILQIARRMLQQIPEAYHLTASCEGCASIHGCPDCDNEDHDH